MKPAILLLALLLTSAVHADAPPEDIPMYAVSLVGSPYRMGGVSPDTGLDCSGFVGHVVKQTLGVLLPRTSSRTGKVMVSSLSDPYWRDRFDGARRIPAAAGEAPADAAE
ncbi:MAG: hypothetical protein B7X81_03505 [Hydrogenophilales bacterium 17-61-76]|nr:MAG: hypothetical protein B7X81_03505 [Hydrogenophilales bacterium 17-61-76]